MTPLHAKWAAPAAVALLVAGLAVAAKDLPRPDGHATQADPPTPAEPAPSADAKDLVPLPLELPIRKIIGTPANFPPVRMKPVPRQSDQRKPFLAPRGSANVALRKPVTGSDPHPTLGELKQVTDGNKDAGEFTYVELGPGPQYVQIDLGRPHVLHAVVLWHEHHQYVVYHDVVVQAADDKDFITNVRTLFSNDHDNSAGLGIGTDWAEYPETYQGLLVDAKAVTARFVRVYSNGSTSADVNRFTEVEVYGAEAK